ncbi:MAG: membrane protein [Candidatus Parcubacteria bacterium]|nr:MAG: membrane protein [Candidatus Parcubacteria bacterium]
MNLFEYSFLLKSLIISLWLSIVFALLGIFVFIKRMSFFSDGIAHSAVLGLAIAFLLKSDILVFALLNGILFSLLIYYLERKTKIHADTLIGLVFVSSLSLGLILISLKASYQPELLNFLIGNILTISDFDFILTIFFSLLILSFIIWQFPKINLVLLDPVEARLRKINVNLYEFLFYLILGISVILGIKLVGVILITAFLILPAATSALISSSFKSFIYLSIIFALFNVIFGFLISNFYNFPLGASIVLSGSSLFFLLFLIKNVFTRI